MVTGCGTWVLYCVSTHFSGAGQRWKLRQMRHLPGIGEVGYNRSGRCSQGCILQEENTAMKTQCRRNSTVYLLSVLLAVSILFVAVSFAADNPSPTVTAVIGKDLHVKRVKVGETIYAKTTQVLVLKDGRHLKEGTKLIGHITVINIKPTSDTPSQLGLVFDKVLVDKEEVPIVAIVVSIGPPAHQPGADAFAVGNNKMNSGDRMAAQASGSGTGAGGNADPAKGILAGGVGRSSMGEKDADLQPGMCLLEGMTLKGMTSTDPGTIVESKKSQVLVDSQARMLLVLKQD